MFELVRPQMDLYAEWLEAHREWGPGTHEDGFAIGQDADVDTEQGFRAWVDRLHRDPGELWWVVEDGRVLGGATFRSLDDERLPRLGHVSYGIRPSARGRGAASWALGELLTYAAGRGVDPVLAVCRDDNVGSIATLEHFDATLQETKDDDGVRVRHYALSTARFRPLH